MPAESQTVDIGYCSLRESNRNSPDTDEPDAAAGHDENQPSDENGAGEFPSHRTFSGQVLARPTDDGDQYPAHVVPSSHVSGGNPPVMRSVSTHSQPPDDESRPVPVRNQTNHQSSVRTQGTLNQPLSRSANASRNSGSVVIHSPPTRATNTGQPVTATTGHHPTVPEASRSQTLTNTYPLQSQPPARSSASSRPAAASSSAAFTPSESSNAVQNLPSVHSYSPVQPSRPSAVHSQPIVSPNAPQ